MTDLSQNYETSGRNDEKKLCNLELDKHLVDRTQKTQIVNIW